MKLSREFIKKYDLRDTEFNNIPCWYTDLHLEQDAVPESWFKYDIRESDNGEPFAAIEKNPVVVNYGGCMLVGHELDFGDSDFIQIEEDF